MREKWKSLYAAHRKIVLFLSGQSVSLFGSALVQYALTWYIARTTQSGAMVAVSTICGFLPQILVSLFSGVWADRYDRRKLIMLADGGIALATLILAVLLMSGVDGIVPIIVIMAIRSFGSGIQSPAVSALIPQITPEDRLMRVNSINGTVQSFVLLLAPTVGGAVLSVGSLPAVLMIDVVTAAIAILIMARLRIPPHARVNAPRETGALAELKEGLSYAWRSTFIRKLWIYNVVACFLVVPAAIFNVLFVTRVYGDGYTYLMLNEIAFCLGSIAGGVLLAAWGGFKNRMTTLFAGFIAFGFLTILMGLKPLFWLYLFVMLITGITMPTVNTPVMVLLQEKVPGDMMGRVMSLNQILFTSVMLLATAVYGPLMDYVPIERVMIVTGALMMGAALAILFDRKLMREGLPKGAVAEPG